MRAARAFLLSCVVAACSADHDAGDGPGDAKGVVLEGVSSGNLLDDLRFVPTSRVVVAAPGGSHRVHRVDVDAASATSFAGVSGSADSVDEGDGLLFVADRGARQIDVIDVASKKLVFVRPLDTSPDYLRYSSKLKELWVTEPRESRIEVLKVAFAGSPVLARDRFVFVKSGPEGLVFDEAHDRAYVHHYVGTAGVIDTSTHAEIRSWETGCANLHGIPVVDARRRLVFFGCRETPRFVVLDGQDDAGTKLGEGAVAGGVSVLAYSASLGHFYLRGDPGNTIKVFGIKSTVTELGTFTTADEGHGMAADDGGRLWVADPKAGRLLRFVDGFPSSL